MHKVAWRHFRHAVYTRVHVYASGHEKVSSGNLGSGTLADKTPAHWPRPTENWWSDPQSELLDWQNPETGPKLSADPRSTVFFKSANPLDLSPKSTIRELFKAKSADPRTYSPPSLTVGPPHSSFEMKNLWVSVSPPHRSFETENVCMNGRSTAQEFCNATMWAWMVVPPLRRFEMQQCVHVRLVILISLKKRRAILLVPWTNF